MIAVFKAEHALIGSDFYVGKTKKNIKLDKLSQIFSKIYWNGKYFYSFFMPRLVCQQTIKNRSKFSTPSPPLMLRVSRKLDGFK